MNKEMLARMMRATELTRGGRLADAAAVIQAALGQTAPAAAGPSTATSSRAIASR